MAQVILSTIGSAVGGPLGGAIGAAVGGAVDRLAIASLAPARQGPRLSGLQVQSSAEGAPMAAVFGRARIAGEILWAARFTESRVESRTGGGKGGPKSVDYQYALSFAVGLCEGLIDGVGRVWADGQPMDMTGVVMRVHPGTDDQAPDALIEAVEGAAPAFRGTAYVVFETLDLTPYGNRPPQLAFEVFRRPRIDGEPALEDRLKAVCLIPGAGEFVYATEPVRRWLSITRSAAETVNNTDGRPDLVVSLDQLQAQLPNVEQVTLVVSWFGDDLRCGHCRARPGVEEAVKATQPWDWIVGGIGRADAHLVSTHDGGPAYGGTPADRAVIEAIAELKRRGLKVVLYPFLMMDIPSGNGLSDPYGGAEQAAYPWRGRITCDPAPGRAGSPDKTGAATAQVAAFFGAAAPGDFSAGDNTIVYSGPDEWSFRRMVLHHAHLAALAGGVDGFLIGSELRGLTTVRNGPASYPAVAALRALAADCRTVLGTGTAIGYAADWSEYFGHQPTDGSGDVFFHLDPLWADAAIDFVGVDWYPPITDWREGDDHLDAIAGFKGAHDPAYLAARIAGGEGFDWFYASDADRLAQTRTPISDGAYGEPWVFRPKDLQGWWSNAHHDRAGGVRAASPTAWVPQGKPIRLIEFGCPAVDKGANAPNLFIDPKSAESALPPFSTGARDDLGQRRALEAVLARFDDATVNPISSVYGGSMVDTGAISAWCWDARPFPDFPARQEVWADAPNWRLGHWLNGRAGVAPLPDLLSALAARGGVEIDAAGIDGFVTGYVVDRPMRLRDAIAPLAEVYAFDAAEPGDLPALLARDGPAAASLASDDLAWPEDRPAQRSATRTLEASPDTIRVRFIDEGADYQTGSASVTREDMQGGGSVDLDLPMVIDSVTAEAAAWRALRRPSAERDGAVLYVSPLTALKIQPGDVIEAEGLQGLWRVTGSTADERAHLTLVRTEAPDAAAPAAEAWRPSPAIEPAGPPVLIPMDLPPLNGAEADARPLAAVAAEPWRAMDLWAGPSADAVSARGRAGRPASLGQTLSDLPAGPLWRWDRTTRLQVQIEGEALQSRSEAEVLSGLNALAVLTPSGEWEILQFATAVQTGADAYELSDLLRGQAGTEGAMASPTPAGAAAVLLTADLARADVSLAERGLPLVWRAAPAGGPASGPAMTEASFTWTGIAYRPWAPAHLAATPATGGLEITWVRRARVGGDGWDSEPPLSEEIESYLLDILDAAGMTVVRSTQVYAPSFLYEDAMQAADFPSGLPDPLTVRVRQWSGIYGWGAAAERALAV